MNFLYYVIISPIETLVDWIFNFITVKIEGIGVIGAIFGVSLAINFLALPLYNVAESLQEKERKIEKSLEYRVGRIKKAFTGDERFMMLSAYYRENNYHPLFVLRSSLSILIEIPFFIAAYHYLSHNETLLGSSFWIFKDLGLPDNFFSIGSFQIHVLPILMTLINLVSGSIYSKDAPVREKIQLYGISLVFLVLLYNSPCGLVIYWILNNIFSLVKNIVLRTKNPSKVLHAVLSFICLCASIYFFTRDGSLFKKLCFFAFSLCIVLLPLSMKLLRRFDFYNFKFNDRKNLFFTALCGFCMAILCGVLVPSNVIASNPVDFSFIGKTENPISYIFSSFFVFLGFFLFWPTVIFKMFGTSIRKLLPLLFFSIVFCSFANVFVFKGNYGEFNIFFELADDSILSDFNSLFAFTSIILFLATFSAGILLSKKDKISVFSLLIIVLGVAECIASFNNIRKITREFNEYKISKLENKSDVIQTEIHLSKENKNVLYLFMDRALGSYFPFFLEQFPECKNSFDGFKYFSNTLSFADYTLTGSPVVMGGYDYTAEEMAKRTSETLVEKFKESTAVLPKLFSDNGYEVTVLDAPWTNFSNEPDYSLTESIPNVTVKKIKGKYSNVFMGLMADSESNPDEFCRKEIRNFSILQILFPQIRKTFYICCNCKPEEMEYFIESYSNLYFLSEMTAFDSEKNNYIFMDNETCHSPSFVDESFTFPARTENRNTGKYITNGSYETKVYSTFCAAFKKLAEYFNFLKKNGAWDNTKIVIVSDHGFHSKFACFNDFDLSKIKNPTYDLNGSMKIPESFDAILMFKDFDSKGSLETDDYFMTNADGMFFVKQNLENNDINPFTKKKFLMNKENGINAWFQKYGEDGQDVCENPSTTLVRKTAWHIKPGDKKNPENWIPLLKWENAK